MSAEYLGKVNGVISIEELISSLNINYGNINKIVVPGDISWMKFKKGSSIFLLADDNVALCTHNTLFKSHDEHIKTSRLLGVNKLITGSNENPGVSAGGEWNEFIVDLVPDNSESNWSAYATVCLETLKSNFSYNVCRGKNSVNEFSNSQLGVPNGWRPLIELKGLSPSFSINNMDLNNLIAFAPISYIVTSEFNDNFSIIENLDGNAIRTLENQTSGTQYTLDLSDRWDSISYGKHTIEIIATDTNGLSSTVTITFNKIKEPITTLPTTASLKQAIAHNKEIDKEIDYQCFRLSSYLKEKDIEITEEDKNKLSSLIGKVGGIELGKKWASGTILSPNSIKASLKCASGQILTNNYYFCTIDSLSFKPSYVLITEQNKMYPNKIGVYSDISTYGKCYILSSYYQDTGYTASHITYVEYGELTVSENGFKFPVALGNQLYNWIAFE